MNANGDDIFGLKTLSPVLRTIVLATVAVPIVIYGSCPDCIECASAF